MRIFLLTVFLSALISRQALAQGQNGLTISGIVQDQTKAVLPGAQVELLKNGTLERTTITDTSGAFRFDRIQREIMKSVRNEKVLRLGPRKLRLERARRLQSGLFFRSRI